MKNKKLLVSLLLVTSSLTLLGSCGRNNNTTSTISTPSIDDYDVVGQTKLNLDDDLFNTLMTKKKTSDYDKTLMDFNRDGVERMLTNTDYVQTTTAISLFSLSETSPTSTPLYSL